MIQRHMPGNDNVQWQNEQLHDIASDNPKELATHDNKTSAMMMARHINHFNSDIIVSDEKTFAQTHSLKKGTQKFGEPRAVSSARKETEQMHQRVAFEPVDPSKLTPTERKKAMHSLIFPQEKNSDEAKARTCADGQKQRIHSDKEDDKSPTAATESVVLTAVIEAKEE